MNRNIYFHCVWCCGSITRVFSLFLITTMNRLFNNKRKKSPESFPQATFPTIPIDIRRDVVLKRVTIRDDAAKEAAGTFGPLKVVLGAIPALYANSEVRLRSPTQNTSLTNTSAGNHHHWGKNRRPPLTCGRIGGTFCHASR